MILLLSTEQDCRAVEESKGERFGLHGQIPLGNVLLAAVPEIQRDRALARQAFKDIDNHG